MLLRALQTMAEGGLPPRMLAPGELFETNEIQSRDYVDRGLAETVEAGKERHRPAAPTTPASPPYTGKKRGPKPKNKMKRAPANKSARAKATAATTTETSAEAAG